tara:strand:- start:13454 stop:15262 length:1809 start_codon:yes stop_codon:yes gene_type:complete
LESSEQFVEIASGHITNRGRADKISNLPNLIGKQNDKHELYHSWYGFDKDLDRHLDGVNRIGTYKGVYYVNQIILDLDLKNLSEKELLETVRFFVKTELIEDLGIKENHIQVWYSGTGFHVVLPDLFGFTPSVSLPLSVKSTLMDVFPDCDKIYDGARLIRAPYSYNKKSGLYKTPISLQELFASTMDDIKRKASTIPDEINLTYFQFHKTEPYLRKYLKLYTAKMLEKTSVKRSTFDIDPTTVVTCMQSVLSKPPVHGERNESMMRLAAWLRRSGVPYNVVQDTLEKWSGNHEEAKTTTDSEFEKGYNYWCNDHIMHKYCDPKCIHYKRKDYSMAVENMKTLAEKYKKFLSTGISKSAFNFKDLYDWNLDYWVMPGELVILLGDTGMGKSTYLSNLAVMLKSHKILYVSMENTWHLTYKRFTQIAQQYTQKETNRYHNELDDLTNLYSSFDHINAVHIRPEINKLQEEVAKTNPDILMIDPTNKIHVKNIHNEFDRMNEIITKLKDIAVNQECVVIAVHHVNKESAKTGVVDINSAKGSSTVIQEADKVWTINGTRVYGTRTLDSGKNRDGKGIRLNFEFDKERMIFKQVPQTSEAFAKVS